MERLLNFLIKQSIVLAVFLVPLAWSPWTLEAFEFPKQYLLIFLVLVGFLAWLAKMVVVEREIHIAKTPLNPLLFLLVVVLLLSTFFSEDRWSSLFGTYGRFSDGVLGTIAGIGLLFLVVNTQRKPSSLVRPLLLSSLLAIFVGYLSLFGVLSQFSQLPPGAKVAGFTTAAESMEGFSVFLAFLVSFLTLLLLRSGTKFMPRTGTFLVLFSALGVLFLLDFPKAWFILLFGLVLAVFLGLFQRLFTGEAMQLRKLWLPLFLLLSIIIFFLSPLKAPGLAVKPLEQPALSQETSWNIAFKTLGESVKNLLLGSGPGTFALDFSLHRPSALNETDQWQTRFDRPGNHLAEVLSTTGILGFLVFLLLILWFLLASLFFSKSIASVPYLGGVLVLVGAEVVYPQITLLQLLFWLFLALSILSWQLPSREFRFSLKRFPEFDIATKAFLLLVFFGTAALFFFGARFFAADANYLAALQAPSSSPALKIERAQKAVRDNPWQAEYRMFLSRVYLSRALTELRRPEDEKNQEQISKDVQLAIAYTRGDTLEEQRIVGAIELAPNRVESWETLGAIYRDIQDAPGALEWGILAFENALVQNPTNPVLYTELGKLLVAKEEYEKAKEAFEKAAELKPNYIEAQLQLGLVREKQGDAKGALSTVQEVSFKYPLHTESAFQLGRLLYNTGQVAQATAQFEKVLVQTPNHSNALFALGVAYESQGRIEDAIAQFEKVLQLNPGNQAVEAKLQELRE